MDLDLRKLRYFVAVAEHRHFGRAAQALFIAQPVLSRQIRAFEQELGCPLFTRTTRSVELTPVGQQLYDEASRITTVVDVALRRVYEAQRGEQRLVVAFSGGLHVSEAIRAFTASHPDVEVNVLPLPWPERDAPLRDGRAHVGYLRRPFDDSGLHTVPIGHDTKVACLPVTHPLALPPRAHLRRPRRSATPRRQYAADVLPRGEVRAHRLRAGHRARPRQHRRLVLPPRPRLSDRRRRPPRRDLPGGIGEQLHGPRTGLPGHRHRDTAPDRLRHLVTEEVRPSSARQPCRSRSAGRPGPRLAAVARS